MPKNFRQVPHEIIARLERVLVDDVVAACAKRVRLDELAKYQHLGIAFVNGELILPNPTVPPETAGKYSNYNVNGKDIKRTDLPKTFKTFSFYAPNWGDSSNGEHLVSHTREVYQREFIPPKLVELSVTLLARHEQSVDLKFSIEQVINRQTPGFEAELLYNLNLLQENVGAADVFESAATLEDYAATIHVDWELLPIGRLSIQEIRQRIIQRAGGTQSQQGIIATRLQTFEELEPTHFVSGNSGFARYFGAKYDDNFVVFENVRYGNAMYVMFENWTELSKRSRIDLLKGPRDGFERIEHREGWEDRLRALLEYHRNQS